MNALEFDAMTLHWQFANGPAQVCKLAAALTYAALTINIYDKVSDQLVFNPNCVIERGGFRIGIVGIASNLVDKSDELRATGARQAARRRGGGLTSAFFGPKMNR